VAIKGLFQAFEQERTEKQATIRVRTLHPAPNILPMPTHTPHNAPPTFQRHPVTRRRVRIQQSASQPTPGIIHNNVQRSNQMLSQQPLQGYYTEAMDTEEQPTKNIREPAVVGSEKIRPQSVVITPRQTLAMTGRELPGTYAANNTLASTNRKRTHQDPDEHDASQSRQI